MVDDELEQAQSRFQRCIEQRDQEAVEQVLDADYTLMLVLPRPAFIDRAQWLATLPDYHVHSYDVEERQLHVDGAVAAVPVAGDRLTSGGGTTTIGQWMAPLSPD